MQWEFVGDFGATPGFHEIWGLMGPQKAFAQTANFKWYVSYSEFRKRVVSKSVVLADVPRYQKPERRFIRMLPGPKNRNEGTFGFSPVQNRNEGAFPKTTLLRNRPFVSSRLVSHVHSLGKENEHPKELRHGCLFRNAFSKPSEHSDKERDGDIPRQTIFGVERTWAIAI